MEVPLRLARWKSRLHSLCIMFSIPFGGSRLLQIGLGCALALLLGTTSVIVLRGTAQAEAEVTPNGADDLASQPIAFSHQLHAGELEFDCQLCHPYARRGPVAGIPSVARCVGCHRIVKVDRPEIVKILQYWEDEEPIPWVRVHSLPDHVRFTHKRHVRAGVACQTCHGDVTQMDAAQQVEPLTMGWCLSCHEERQASIDCLTCHS